MTLFRMFDAAYPPATAYPGCQAVAGYIGGNTPHVWTQAEWLRFSSLRQLPVWVGYLEDDPVQHARSAAAAAQALGWRPFRPGTWRAIVADMEAQMDEPWLLAFGTELQSLGFLCWPYMSLSALPSVPPGYTVWLADWNGVPAIPPVHDVIAHQYQPNVAWDGTAVDLSVVDASVLDSFGEGARA